MFFSVCKNERASFTPGQTPVTTDYLGGIFTTKNKQQTQSNNQRLYSKVTNIFLLNNPQ